MAERKVDPRSLAVATLEASAAISKLSRSIFAGHVAPDSALALGRTAIKLADALSIAIEAIDGANAFLLAELRSKLAHCGQLASEANPARGRMRAKLSSVDAAIDSLEADIARVCKDNEREGAI